MCLLITQTNSKVISKEKLQNADKNNPDGMGFTYSNGTALIVEKFREFSGNSKMVCNIGGRGAINLANSKTIELRFFGGSLSEMKYKAKIDFVQAVYEYTQNSSFTHQNVKGFTSYVNSNNKFRALQGEFDTDNFKRVIKFPKAQPSQLNY